MSNAPPALRFDATEHVADERLRGPHNQTAELVMANFSRCEVFNMSSVFFDFFRIYYRVEGWDRLIRALLAKVERLYPERLQDRGPEARPFREWTSAVNASRGAAQRLKQFMEWRDDQAPYVNDEGPKTQLLVLMGGLRTSPHNLTGYYKLVRGQQHEGRPVYQQLLLPDDLAGGHVPNYIYATTEWYSNVEMWAVGPDVGATDTWLKVNSDSEAPHEITTVWQELSEEFPVGYHANPGECVCRVKGQRYPKRDGVCGAAGTSRPCR